MLCADWPLTVTAVVFAMTDESPRQGWEDGGTLWTFWVGILCQPSRVQFGGDCEPHRLALPGVLAISAVTPTDNINRIRQTRLLCPASRD